MPKGRRTENASRTCGMPICPRRRDVVVRAGGKTRGRSGSDEWLGRWAVDLRSGRAFGSWSSRQRSGALWRLVAQCAAWPVSRETSEPQAPCSTARPTDRHDPESVGRCTEHSPPRWTRSEAGSWAASGLVQCPERSDDWPVCRCSNPAPPDGLVAWPERGPAVEPGRVTGSRWHGQCPLTVSGHSREGQERPATCSASRRGPLHELMSTCRRWPAA